MHAGSSATIQMFFSHVANSNSHKTVLGETNTCAMFEIKGYDMMPVSFLMRPVPVCYSLLFTSE